MRWVAVFGDGNVEFSQLVISNPLDTNCRPRRAAHHGAVDNHEEKAESEQGSRGGRQARIEHPQKPQVDALFACETRAALSSDAFLII